MTSDGELVIFQPKMKPNYLRSYKYITELTYEEVKNLRYVNYDRLPTQSGIEKFDDLLENFKG